MLFGVREICNVVFKAKDTRKIGATEFHKGEPVIYFDSLKTSSFEQATTTVYAQGGRGNTRLIAWDGEKTLTFTMEDALISPEGLAILAGAKLFTANANGDVLVAHVTETINETGTGSDKGYYVSKKPSASLSASVSGATATKAYALLLNDNREVTSSPISVTISPDLTTGLGYKISFTDTPESGVYLIDYYTDYSDSKTKQIDIEPQVFGGNFYIEADTLFRDKNGTDHAAQFIIPNGKVQSNFTFSMASSGDPSTFTFTVDAFPGIINGDATKQVMASIQIIGDTTADIDIDEPAGDEDISI